jgi:two-component system OmpR family sensor kinase
MRRLDHEVKNPLTAMRAALANINGSFDPTTMRSMRNQVDRLARLSADLRKLTDLEIQPLEMDDVDLPALLSELVETAQDRPDAASRRIILGLPQAPWPLTPVPGDRDLLFLAFHNLIDNALKFSGDGATIEIRAFEDGSDVGVEVADTGPGVPPEELPHLGEELYRGSGAVGVEGSGLGLALVRAIITRHGGTLAIRSRPGRGTVVTVKLRGAR